MDRDQFDTLAQHVWTKRSRRAALAAVAGAALLGRVPVPLLAKRRGRGKARVGAEATTCYPGTRCTPGKGKNASGCDFSHSTVFQNRDARGSNLSNSNFLGAVLRGADFRGANLSGSCFLHADLTGARLGGSVNLGGAVFCQTTMPDGRVDDSGCDKRTACCPHPLQSCPDAEIGCYVPFSNDICDTLVGTFGPVGHCYSFPACCPCDHTDFAFWTEQCNTSFPACNGQCVANDGEVIGIRCFQGCLG